jgi:NADH-quinone oxidoreductase subunit N
MYMKDPSEEFEWTSLTAPVALALVLAVAGTLILGIVPSFVLQYAQMAVSML